MLAVALMLPFWLLGALSGWQILPGLPLSALGAACPGAAAVLCAYREGGRAGAAALLALPFAHK